MSSHKSRGQRQLRSNTCMPFHPHSPTSNFIRIWRLSKGGCSGKNSDSVSVGSSSSLAISDDAVSNS